jgi:hypothetical protein
VQGEAEAGSPCPRLEKRTRKNDPGRIRSRSFSECLGSVLALRFGGCIFAWLLNGRFQRLKDDAGGLLDDFKALGEECRVAFVEVDVVGGRPPRIESNRSADYERDCLGLGLTHGLRGRGAALGLVQHLVREFVNKRAELFGFALSGEDGDSA